MNSNDSVLSKDYLKQLTQYVNAVYNEAMAKLNNGAKRILIALPVGFGKTTMLTRIAKNICSDSGINAIFIVSAKAYEEQLKHRIAEELPQMTIITFFELKRHNYEELTNKQIIFVDSLCISDRRELTIRLKDFPGIIVTASNFPFDSQEVKS